MDKTWKVSTSCASTEFTHEIHVKAETLYDAFAKYDWLFGTTHLTKIRITEVKQNERSEGIPGTHQVV